MSEELFRDALLKQNGHGSVDQELTNLHALIERQTRRARWLTFWTVVVWAVWVLMLAAAFGAPIVSKMTAPPAATQPRAAAPIPPPAAPTPHSPPMHHGTAGAIIGILLVTAFFVLPFIGIVLTVMMVLGRRSAAMSHIRGSLAAIDAQLRLLEISRGQSASHP